MADLGTDLANVLAGKPVDARTYGPLARMTRWSRRHRAAAAVVAFAFVFLVVGAVVAVVKSRDLAAHLENATLAAGRADDALRAAEDSNLRYARLADRRRLGDLEARAERLLPPVPAILPALNTWLSEAADLARELDGHRRALDEVRSRRLERTLEQPAGRARNLAQEIDGLRARLPALPEESPVARSLRLLIDRLTAVLPTPVERWSYASSADAWRDEVLSRLIADLERFTSLDRFRGTMTDLSHRRDEIRGLERELSDTAALWERACRSIADPSVCPRYAGLRIKPQLGLVPLRRDPASGLWEFRHVLTGQAPRDPAPDDSLEIAPETGVVLVLVPGGVARLGSRRPGPGDPPQGPHLDPLAHSNESPIDDVALDPFFISKYEMTESQWVRISGLLPGPDVRAAGRAETRKASTLPVSSISWVQAHATIARVGLELPTEAQWEYAARAGTTTPWWTGVSASSLNDVAVFETDHPALVGGRPPNTFGLHDVAGNVSEWCRDSYGKYIEPNLPGSGERVAVYDGEHRVRRGGGYLSPANELRSACRGGDLPRTRPNSVGVRPGRSIVR